MKVSVVLIGYNSWHFLKKNLKSLEFMTGYPDMEIIYIDNASTDHTINYIREYFPFVKTHTNSKNLGIAKARNMGIIKATGKYIWILDSDTEVTEKAFNFLYAFMEQHPEAGLCGCKMYGQDGSIQESCRLFPSIKGKLKAGAYILLKKLRLVKSSIPFYSYNKDYKEAFEVDYVIGACQFIRKEAQKKVGFLDENIFYGPEDADFCLRMKQAGYLVYYLPQISIYHDYQRASSHKIFSKINLKHIQGLIYYFKKHTL
ncbi:glycosyltransferase family 2 protein [Bacteroidales bacterium OttesenSCG-928-M06]|nr:glycosyltransferase family 2 protein [Bacteroidales bacterium OttesenSCG-928-M06]